MSIRVIQVSVPPAPRHHAGHFRDVEALLLKLSAEIVEIGDFKVQAHAITRNGSIRTRLMQSDRPIAAGSAQARIHCRALMAEVFDELESKQIAVETGSALNVLNVDHGVVESKFPAGIGSDGRLAPWRLGLAGSGPRRRARMSALFYRGFS